MKTALSDRILRDFETRGPIAYTLSELRDRIQALRRELNIPPRVRTQEILDVLVGAGLNETVIRPRERARPNASAYKPFRRYLWMNPSAECVALSLRAHSFLSHETAATHLGLAVESSKSRVIVNREQSAKSHSLMLSQAAIDQAFKSKPRATRFVFDYEGVAIWLVSGKNTNRIGVFQTQTAFGEVSLTTLERTLVDMAVRPVYSGGTRAVLAAFCRARDRVDVALLSRMLAAFGYVYPYEQVIGFYLSRAGFPISSLSLLREKSFVFDFYLDYAMENAKFDREWRVHYPADLD